VDKYAFHTVIQWDDYIPGAMLDATNNMVNKEYGKCLQAVI
jgi:hypothetical protein